MRPEPDPEFLDISVEVFNVLLQYRQADDEGGCREVRGWPADEGLVVFQCGVHFDC